MFWIGNVKVILNSFIELKLGWSCHYQYLYFFCLNPKTKTQRYKIILKFKILLLYCVFKLFDFKN